MKTLLRFLSMQWMNNQGKQVISYDLPTFIFVIWATWSLGLAAGCLIWGRS